MSHPDAGRAYDPIKRLMDLAVSSAALVLASPVLLLAAAAIKLTSKGPVIYRARRAGRHAEPFDMLKLRTMTVGADRQGAITAGGDARVTAVGRLLRATKIDELPQLWNILRGDMSLVGPRPEALSIVEEHYTPEHAEALAIRPGLTCTGNLYHYLYQEHLRPPAGMGAEEFYVRHLLDPKIAADLHYVRYRTLLYDLRLLVETLWVTTLKILGQKPRWQPPKDAALNPPVSGESSP